MHPVGHPYREHVPGAGLPVDGLSHTDVARVRVQRQRRFVVITVNYRVRQFRVQVGIGSFQRGNQRTDRYFFGNFILDRHARPRRTVVVFVQNLHCHLRKQNEKR